MPRVALCGGLLKNRGTDDRQHDEARGIAAKGVPPMRIRRGIFAGVIVTVMVAAGATANAAPEAQWGAALAILVTGGLATLAMWAVLTALARRGGASSDS